MQEQDILPPHRTEPEQERHLQTQQTQTQEKIPAQEENAAALAAFKAKLEVIAKRLAPADALAKAATDAAEAEWRRLHPLIPEEKYQRLLQLDEDSYAAEEELYELLAEYYPEEVED